VTPSQKPSQKQPAAPEADDALAELSYEQARDALIDVVRRLEGGAETLEESLALWERGEALAWHCEQWLAGAQARLDAGKAPAADKTLAADKTPAVGKAAADN
jgi:exodeoxyribonuclease VII small subunit